jgi:putative serine protease PepD
VCAAVEASDWDDGDEPRPDPYLPPEERWWRHPSELGGPGQPLPVGRPALLTAPGGGRVALALAVAIGAAGAVLAAYVAHLAQPATDEVATTIVRVTAATTAPVVTVASTVPPSAVPGVVQLVMPSGSSKRSGTAAAVTNGQLVTSAQMVAGMTQVTAVMPDGSEQQATVVVVDPASGTAVLEIAQPTPTLASGQAATLGPGDPVTAAGTNTAGQVEAVGVEVTASDGTEMQHLLKLRMEEPVADGTVLLDDDGRAVGICIGAVEDDARALLAAPIELAKAATSDRGPDGVRRLSWLGLTGRAAAPNDIVTPPATSMPPDTTETTDVTTTTAAPSSSTASSAPTTEDATTSSEAPPTAQPVTSASTPPGVPVQGAYVVDVDADGAAAEAGVLEGDIVVAVDDVPVHDMNALILLIRERKVGRTVHLTLIRDGQTIQVDAVLRGRPAD